MRHEDEGDLQNHLPKRDDKYGMELTYSINYFGSADRALFARDFTRNQRKHITVGRKIIRESETTTDAEVPQ